MDEKIKILQDKVNQITLSNEKCLPSSSGCSSSSFFPKFNYPVIYYYGAIPCLILIILFIYKPMFVMEDVSIDGKFPEKRLSYKKLLVATVVATAILCVIIFVYFYRTKKTHMLGFCER
jgi:hypothetical protein